MQDDIRKLKRFLSIKKIREMDMICSLIPNMEDICIRGSPAL